jgi:hypothetical protein
MVCGFIAAYPKVIEEGFSADDAYAGCTPRDFERLSRLEKAGAVSSNYDIALLQIIGNIGSSAGYKYVAFRQLDLPAVSHVLDNPQTAPILDEQEKQFAYSAAIIGAAEPQHFENITAYALRLNRVNGFAMCWDLRKKFKSYESSTAAVKAADAYQDLFA